jgi:hypothetical protein
MCSCFFVEISFDEFSVDFGRNTQLFSQDFLKKRKTHRFSKNKTHKTLTTKILFGITLPVARVTALETSEGIGEQSGDTLGESKAERFVVAIDARR